MKNTYDNKATDTKKAIAIQNAEISLLEEQELIIQRGLDGFIQAGKALKVIKEKKLYKERYK